MKTGTRSILIGIAVIAFVQLFPGRSFGWGNTWLGISLEEIVNTSRWKLGALKYNAAFRIDNAGYDSDIYFGSAGRPVPDYTLFAGPDISFFLPLAKGIILDVSEIPQYVFYLRTTKDRALNNDFWGQIHFAGDRLFFQIGGAMLNAKERLSSELDINIRQIQNELSGLAFWQISEKTAMALQARAYAYRYETPPDSNIDFQQTLDRNEIDLNLAAYLQQSARMRYFLDAEFASFNFTNPVSSFKDSRSYGVYGGIEFLPSALDKEPGKGLGGTINLGYKYFDILDPNQRGYKGLVGNTGLIVNSIQFTKLRASFTRDIQFSAYASLSCYVQTTVSAGISRALNRTITLSYDIAFIRDDYGQFQIVPAGDTQTDDYINHVFGLGLRLGRDLQLNFLASIGQRSSSTIDQINVNHRNFFGFSLVYGVTSRRSQLATGPFSRQ